MAGNTISALLDVLEHSDDFTFEALERILEENLPSSEEIIAAADAVLPYGRSMLALTDRYEVIIGCWPKGGWCDAHDHGNAIGIVYAYGGEIEHFRYHLDERCLDLVEHETLRKDQCIRLEHGMIHSLQNISSDEPYIGLHIYSPPTSNARVFDLKTGDIYHVTDDHAALIPKDPKKILRHEKKQFTFQNSVKAQAVKV
jgi:predicted metal-dependent enzyme (double-stranded beta helix superfamily)